MFRSAGSGSDDEKQKLEEIAGESFRDQIIDQSRLPVGNRFCPKPSSSLFLVLNELGNRFEGLEWKNH